MQIKRSINNNRTFRAIDRAKLAWLKNEISYHHARLNNLNIATYSLQQKLTEHYLNIGRHDLYKNFLRYVTQLVHHKTKLKLVKLNRKFKRLIENRDPKEVRVRSAPMQIENFVVNQSSKKLNEEELQLLNRGLKFSIKFVKPPIDKFVVAIQPQITSLEESDKNFMIDNSFRILNRSKTDYKITKEEKRQHEVLQQLKLNDVYMTKADKSNNIVILDKDVYDERFQKLIDDGPYELVDSDPLPGMIRDAIEEFYSRLAWTLKVCSTNSAC